VSPKERRRHADEIDERGYTILEGVVPTPWVDELAR